MHGKQDELSYLYSRMRSKSARNTFAGADQIIHHFQQQYSYFNYSLSWLIVQRKKAISGLLVDERTGVYRSIGARCGAVGGGVLLLKLVKVVVLS